MGKVTGEVFKVKFNTEWAIRKMTAMAEIIINCVLLTRNEITVKRDRYGGFCDNLRDFNV